MGWTQLHLVDGEGKRGIALNQSRRRICVRMGSERVPESRSRCPGRVGRGDRKRDAKEQEHPRDTAPLCVRRDAWKSSRLPEDACFKRDARKVAVSSSKNGPEWTLTHRPGLIAESSFKSWGRSWSSATRRFLRSCFKTSQAQQVLVRSSESASQLPLKPSNDSNYVLHLLWVLAE